MEIRTPRLQLRELALDDADALLRIEGDERVARYMEFAPRSLEQTHAYIAECLREAQSTSRSVWEFAVMLPTAAGSAGSDLVAVPRQPATRDSSGTTELIGRCGLKIARPQHREASIWYLLRPDCWGNGYAFEAAGRLVRFGFEELGLHRIWADCDPRNTASCRLAEKLGMTFEGKLRENYFLKGEWCDTAVHAVLEGDWRRSV